MKRQEDRDITAWSFETCNKDQKIIIDLKKKQNSACQSEMPFI